MNGDPGTVLITGPTGGLGREATLAMARRPAQQRPDLILVGRAGSRLTQLAVEARTAGTTVHEIGCDLADLTDVSAAASAAHDLLAQGAVRPLRGLVANAGVSVRDTRTASADGYERTFAINTDFEKIVVAISGLAGYAACGWDGRPADFYLQPATRGNPNGTYSVSEYSHNSGGCSDLVRFRENHGPGSSA